MSNFTLQENREIAAQQAAVVTFTNYHNIVTRPYNLHIENE